MPKLQRFIFENHVYHTISTTRGRRPVFKNPATAEILVDTLRFVGQSRKAFVLAYAVMPDHLHLVLVPHPTGTISEVMHSVKGYSAREINKLLGRRGALWQQSFYDRVIRNEEQLLQTVAYVESNPVTAGLAATPSDYRFCSASRGPEADLEAWLADDRG